MRVASLCFALVLVACGADKDDTGADGSPDGGSVDGGSGSDGGSSGGDGGTVSDGGSTGDGGSADGETPWILEADCWCYPHTTGKNDWVWQVTATADDPQGAVSVEGYYDGVTVLQGATTIGTASISCDGDGQCSASFRDSQLGTACGAASSYTVEVRVLDEDDNWSPAWSLTPRQCPDGDPC